MPNLSLIAKLGLDKTGFDAGLSRAGKSGAEFASNLKGQLAGAFGMAALAGYIRQIQQATGRFKDLGEQYGITTDEVQNADFALHQSGLAFEDLGSSMNSIARARRDAVEGTSRLRDTFQKFGLSLQDLNNPALRTFDVLQRIASATAGSNLTAREQVELMDLLGPKAGRLVNVLANLATVKPPALFTEADIGRIDRVVKSFEALKLTLQARSAPLLTAILERTRQTIDALSKGRFGKAWALNPLNPMTGALSVEKQLINQTNDDRQGAALKLAERVAGIGLGLFGGGGGGGGPMFDVDKNLKTKSEKLLKNSPIASDQFQRIGAFSGAAGDVSQALLKEHSNLLRGMHSALTQRGIIIRGTD